MKKSVKYSKCIISFLMSVVILVGIAAVGKHSGIDFKDWFSFNATAATYSGLTANRYMSKILLNSNYSGAANGWDKNNSTNESETLTFAMTPENLSTARAIVNELHDNSTFMNAVTAWKVANFKADNLIENAAKEEDFYSAIILSVLDAEIKSNDFLVAVNSDAAKYTATVYEKSFDLAAKILDAEYFEDLETLNIQDLPTDQFENLVKEMQDIDELASFYEKVSGNGGVDFVMKILKTSKTLYDASATMAGYSFLVDATEATCDVLYEIYMNAINCGNYELYSAAKKVYNFMVEGTDTSLLEMMNSAKCLSGIIGDELLGTLWKDVLELIPTGGFLTGVFVGQAIGNAVSNFVFSTDATIDQYYAMNALVEFEDVMVQTVKNLGDNFKSYETNAKADAYIRSLELLFSTYSLGYDYSETMCKIVFEDGLLNSIRGLFGGKNVTDYAKALATVKDYRGILNVGYVPLVLIESYSPYLEEDSNNLFEDVGGTVTESPKYVDKYAIYYYGIRDGEARINYIDPVSGGNIVIPSSINGYPVRYLKSRLFANCSNLVEIVVPDFITELGDGVFNGCSFLKSVTIGNGVVGTIKQDMFEGCSSLETIVIGNGITAIEDNAFYNLDNLKSVTIGNSVTSIGEAAFKDCDELVSIIIPDSVTSIGEGIFSGCDKLENVTIGDGVVGAIEKNMFEGCSSLETIVIGNGITAIEDNAFYNLDNLKSVTIGNSVTSIGNSAFEGCTSFTSITIPDSVTSIGEAAFKDCDGLVSVIIPDSVTSIDYAAFRGCTSLTSITIPDSVTSIGYAAFRGCTSLTSITIPDSVTSISASAFYNCTGLKELTMPASAKISNSESTFYNCTNIEKVILTKGTGTMQDYSSSTSNDDTYYKYTPWYISRDNIKEIIIEYGVTSIGYYAFYNCTSLTSIEIPDSVTRIYYAAFEGCTSLTSITIPDSVTSIGESAFRGCTSLTSITIPDSVTSIRDFTFWDCYNLTSITISDSVTSIGYAAFYDCTGLKELTMPASAEINGTRYDFGGCTNIEKVTLTKGSGTMQDYSSDYKYDTYYQYTPWYISRSSIKEIIIENGVTSIGACAFWDCYNLTSIEIPDSVTRICYAAFRGCTSLTSITIPDSVTSIGSDVFRDCTSLTSITIPDSVTSIGNYAFSYCYNLTSITIPDSVTIIGNYAFSYCYNLTSIEIPDSVTSIGKYAFDGCTSLTSITIPDSVTSIGKYAFYNCTSLTSITIPDSVTSIGDYAFWYCTSLASVKISDLAAWCNISFYNFSSNPLYYNANLYLNDVLVTDIVIPNSVTSIGDYAFYDCTSLTSIEIPDSVTSIGDGAFYNCTGLKELTMPASAKIYNDEYTFYGCTNIEKVTLTKGSGTMQDYSSSTDNDNTYYQYTPWYISCDNIKEIIIENGLTNIGDYAFRYCYNLTSIEIPDSVTSIGNYAFGYCADLACITIPDSVTSIGNYAFYNCCSLTSITIPDSVTSIGDYAFCGCTSLTSITIPDSVTSIGDYAFYNCCSLTSIEIPDSVTSIRDFTFWDCYNLTSITIPDSVTSIGDYAFRGCTSLTSITIPDSVTGIGYYTFYNCTSLVSVTIPDSVTSIGEYAFSNCTSLTSITIPDSVTSIGKYAFRGCTSLTSITIPDSVTSMGDYAFYNCTSLESITILNKDCNIYDSLNTISSTATIYAHQNSTAKKYADKYSRKFQEICTKVVDEAVAPTCTTTGLTEGLHCDVCGEVFTKQEVIPALGHNINSWASSNNEETGTCSVCGEQETRTTVYKKISMSRIHANSIGNSVIFTACPNAHNIAFSTTTSDGLAVDVALDGTPITKTSAGDRYVVYYSAWKKAGSCETTMTVDGKEYYLTIVFPEPTELSSDDLILSNDLISKNVDNANGIITLTLPENMKQFEMNAASAECDEFAYTITADDVVTKASGKYVFNLDGTTDAEKTLIVNNGRFCKKEYTLKIEYVSYSPADDFGIIRGEVITEENAVFRLKMSEGKTCVGVYYKTDSGAEFEITDFDGVYDTTRTDAFVVYKNKNAFNPSGIVTVTLANGEVYKCKVIFDVGLGDPTDEYDVLSDIKLIRGTASLDENGAIILKMRDGLTSSTASVGVYAATKSGCTVTFKGFDGVYDTGRTDAFIAYRSKNTSDPKGTMVVTSKNGTVTEYDVTFDLGLGEAGEEYDVISDLRLIRGTASIDENGKVILTMTSGKDCVGVYVKTTSGAKVEVIAPTGVFATRTDAFVAYKKNNSSNVVGKMQVTLANGTVYEYDVIFDLGLGQAEEEYDVVSDLKLIRGTASLDDDGTVRLTIASGKDCVGVYVKTISSAVVEITDCDGTFAERTDAYVAYKKNNTADVNAKMKVTLANGEIKEYNVIFDLGL